ncbi:hypothetical protein RNZ50_26645 [Paracoccaceae bacterium Fryx2]|nr:hypothetical protein [Paracoccaceae bacterium Fryx2]
MNWDQIEGKWKQLQGKVLEQWGKLCSASTSMSVTVNHVGRF